MQGSFGKLCIENCLNISSLMYALVHNSLCRLIGKCNSLSRLMSEIHQSSLCIFLNCALAFLGYIHLRVKDVNQGSGLYRLTFSRFL